MSYKDEIALQREDDARYEHWLKSQPEYWARLTDELTANVIASEGLDYFAVSGEITTEEE